MALFSLSIISTGLSESTDTADTSSKNTEFLHNIDSLSHLSFRTESLNMFGQQGASDLLLGASGGFDPSSRTSDVSIGNGYGNSNDPSDSRNASTATTFDLSDFPSLGGATQSGGGAGGDNGGSNGLQAALRQNQLLLAHQHMMQSNSGVGNGASGAGKTSNLYRLATSGSSASANFNMASEDFPALPGAPPQPSSTGANLLVGGVGSGSVGSSVGGLLDSSQENQQQRTDGTASSSYSSGKPVSSSGNNGSGNTMYSSELDSPPLGGQHGGGSGRETTGLLGGNTGLGSLTGISSQHNPHHSRQQGTTSASSSGAAGSALGGDFGLLGLLGVIRMSDADRNALALGSDLTSLGLDLNSSEQLYATFASPWSENAITREPHYQLPMCYYMQPPALKTGHLSKFHLETLFYIFYALPKDVLQAYAAQELYARDWRYHVELQLWFKRATPADGVPSSNNGIQYIYFDINSWERRLFTGSMHQNITVGLLPEDDVRVKFPNT